MSLPPAPPRRAAPRLPPPPPPRRGSAGKLRQLVRRHEEEERPFDPRQPPAWRGSARDLVANPILTTNPSGFRDDLHELVSRYHGKLRTDLSVDELTDELARVFEEERTRDAMQKADELLEGHGVEALGPVNTNKGAPYTYINFGDTYDPTIMWSRDDNKVFVAMGGWGDVWSEEGEPNMLQEGWDDWLGSEFEKKVLGELEAAEEGTGGKTHAELDALVKEFESWDSDQQKQLFEKALWGAQQAGGGGGRKYPEVSQESDGIYVHHLDVVVDKAAELVMGGWDPEHTPNNSGGRFTIEYQAPEGGPWVYGEGDVFDSREEAEEQLAQLREDSRDSRSQFFGYKWEIADYNRNGAAAFDHDHLESEFMRHLRIGDRRARINRGSSDLYVNFINLPEGIGGAGGGAEAENNRMTFIVSGPRGQGIYADDKPIAAGTVRIEQRVSALPREYRLRAKTGTPEAIARYLAEFLNKVAREVPPKFTHTRNARGRVTYRARGTADDHRDRMMLLGRSHRTLSADYATEVEALDAAERFMKDVSPSPLGRAAKVWVEESRPSGDFRVVAKWTGQYGAAGGLIWKPS